MLFVYSVEGPGKIFINKAPDIFNFALVTARVDSGDIMNITSLNIS